MPKKSGFTQFPNQMLEKLPKNHLRPTEYELVLVAARKIFGFHKQLEADHISLSQFVKGTGRKKRTVQNALKTLERRKIFQRLIPGTGRRSTLWKLNTSYDEWDVVEVNERSTLEGKRGVNDRATLQGQKEGENEVKNDDSYPRGEQAFHPEVNGHSTLGDRRGEQTFAHKRKGFKEINIKESENCRFRRLTTLIERQIKETTGDKSFELPDADVDVIRTVSAKFASQKPESLLHAFKNVLGTLDDPSVAVSRWAEKVGHYLPASDTKQ